MALRDVKNKMKANLQLWKKMKEDHKIERSALIKERDQVKKKEAEFWKNELEMRIQEAKRKWIKEEKEKRMSPSRRVRTFTN